MSHHQFTSQRDAHAYSGGSEKHQGEVRVRHRKLRIPLHINHIIYMKQITSIIAYNKGTTHGTVFTGS